MALLVIDRIQQPRFWYFHQHQWNSHHSSSLIIQTILYCSEKMNTVDVKLHSEGHTFLSCLPFYFQETNSLSNYQFLFQDLAITTLIGVTSKPILKLSSQMCFPQIFFLFPPLNSFDNHVENLLAIGTWVYFCILKSIPLVCMSILIPVTQF